MISRAFFVPKFQADSIINEKRSLAGVKMVISCHRSIEKKHRAKKNKPRSKLPFSALTAKIRHNTTFQSMSSFSLDLFKVLLLHIFLYFFFQNFFLI